MGTPLLLQLFLIYFGLIQIGIDLPAFVAGVIGLGLHFAVYNSELIQASILAVDKGQYEGARTLGLSRGQTLRRIVIPQAVRAVIPPVGQNRTSGSGADNDLIVPVPPRLSAGKNFCIR